MDKPHGQVPKDLIIAIGREFGAGGRRVGRMLADHFGLAYYDKEMLSEAASRMGYDHGIFARYDEKRPSVMRSLISNAFGVQDAYLQNPMSSESIYMAQSRVIRELAAGGGCVFVGRTADYILRESPHLVSIFLHAPLDFRAKVLLRRGEASDINKARETASKLDRKRRDFYNYYTDAEWGDAHTYHLTLNSSLLGAEGTFEVIKSYIGSKFSSSTPSQEQPSGGATPPSGPTPGGKA